MAELFQGIRQRRPGGTCRSNVPCLNGGESLERYIDKPPLLLRQGTEPVMELRCLIQDHVLLLVPERSHGVGNGFIETAVQCAEFICRNGRVLPDGQIRNSLADVTIVMDHLINRVSEAKELGTVLSRSPTDVGVNGRRARFTLPTSRC